MSVVGFDIGNENCVVAAFKGGVFDVILNGESKRETPTVVCFGGKQRFLGCAGAAFATMNPKTTITDLKKLIGRGDRGIQINVNYLSQESFTPTQILAMMLSHLKELAERHLDCEVTDCVIGIPSYFQDMQRRAYLNAAKIAGLKPLRLIHDCTASALSYGIHKMDSTSSQIVVIVDIGHSDTQVSIAAFEGSGMKILSHAYDAFLGGSDFDEKIFSHFSGQFKERYGMDITSNIKACMRLKAACEEMKKVLSANTEASLNIECLMDETDVDGTLTRNEFEGLCSELLERIALPCREAVEEAGVPLERIDCVELVGSGSRIPSISKVMSSVFGKEASRTLNASECVARGCAIQCAMLSPFFRVREYEVEDALPFSIGLAPLGGEVFARNRRFPSKKVVTMHRSCPFQLQAYRTEPRNPAEISSFVIGDARWAAGGVGKAKVELLVDINGVFKIDFAKLLEDNPPEDHMVEDDDSPMEDANRETTTYVELPVSLKACAGMTERDVSDACRKELELTRIDKMVENIKHHKNTLESAVYDIRNKLTNKYRCCARDTEREKISRFLDETEEWLYGEGDDVAVEIYVEKLRELERLVAPIVRRYKEEEESGLALNELLNCVANYRSSVEVLAPEYAEQMVKACCEMERWIFESSLRKNDEPVMPSSMIRERIEHLTAIWKRSERIGVSDVS